MCNLLDLSKAASTISNIKHWLGAISLHAPNAPFCWVGTRKDEISQRADHEKISQLLSSLFPLYLPKAVHNTKEDIWFFPVDNTTSGLDDTMAELRKSIENSVHDQEYVDTEIPIKWLACLDFLQGYYTDSAEEKQVLDKKAGAKTSKRRISLTEFRATAHRFGITDESAQTQMLRVFHEFSLLIWYHADPALRDVVILDPQWLLDTFSSVIRDFSLHTRPHDKALLANVSEWLLLKEKAVLNPGLMRCLWPEHTETEVIACVQLMCKHGLAVPFRSSCVRALSTGPQSCEPELVFTNNGHRSTSVSTSTSYLIPSLLPFDLTGQRSDDDLCDTLHEKFQSRLLRYQDSWRGSASLGVDPPAADPNVICFISFYPKTTPRFDVSMRTDELERHSILPGGVYSQLLCNLVQEHQFTSLSAQSLSRTSSDLVFGNVKIRIDIVPHIGAIRIETAKATALRTIHRIESIIESICHQHFTTLQYETFLPFTDTVLLSLNWLQQMTQSHQRIEVNGTLFDPQGYFVELLTPPRQLLEKYHAMISYRQRVNKIFALRLYDLLQNADLQGGHSVLVFLDEHSIAVGRRFVSDFCFAISRAAIAVPLVSMGALESLQQAADSNEPDYLLLEWCLMLELYEMRKLKRILPLFLGDSWCNTQSAINVRSVEEIRAFATSFLPAKPAMKTHELLQTFMTKDLGLPAPQPRGVKDVVLALLQQVGLVCFQQDQASQDQNWTALSQYSQQIVSVIKEAQLQLQAERPSGVIAMDVVEFPANPQNIIDSAAKRERIADKYSEMERELDLKEREFRLRQADLDKKIERIERVLGNPNLSAETKAKLEAQLVELLQ